MGREKPKFTKEAFDASAQVAEDFKDDLQIVAQRIASQDGVERVLISHVESARCFLRKAGYRHVWFFKRPEFELGIGTGLAGAAIGLDDFLKVLPGGSHIPADTEPLIFVATALIGGLLAIHGWSRTMH